MSQPTAYEHAHEFLTDEAANPNFPGSELDIEFAALENTLDEILTNLALIQRDDGALKNAVVTVDALSDAVKAMIGDADVLADLEADFLAIEANKDAAAASATAAAASQSAAATSASSASSSASAASTSAGTATTQASAASSSASSASTSASTATTQASAASASASAAAASAAAAAVSADNFDDVYLGSKAADPTLDNDGNALVEGQLYWNSSSNGLKVYDGAAWQSYNPLTGGDFSSNTAASVDGELVLFSGTAGKTGKRAAMSGLVKAASGVASAAVAGTDYCAATSGSGVLKGSSGSTAAATAGTDFMKPDTTSNLTAGMTTTSYSAGTKSSGTFTPDPALGNIQHYTNGGAHTLAPPSSVCTMIIECTNASAGALTTSGFSIVSGDTFSSSGTKKHVFYITKTNSFSQLHVQYVTGT